MGSGSTSALGPTLQQPSKPSEISPLGLNPSTDSCHPEPLKSQPSGPPTPSWACLLLHCTGAKPASLGPSSSFLPQGLCISIPSAWRALPGHSPAYFFFLSSPLFEEASLSSTTPTITATPFIFFKTAVTPGDFSQCLFFAPLSQPKQKLMGTDVLWLICRCVLHLE